MTKNNHPKELNTITQSLDEARIAHVRWLNELNKQIIFKIPVDSFARNHTECYLGKWLALVKPNKIFNNDDCQKLLTIHKNLHNQANRFLDLAFTGQSIVSSEYELFISTVNDVMQSIEHIQYALHTFSLSLDNLTQLPNRTLLLFMLKKEHAKFERSTLKNKHCIAFVDIDRFKNINDTHGHHAGDIVLKKVAEKLTSCMREGDIVGRYGGDEFLFYLSDVSVQKATTVFERIRSEIENLAITIQTKTTVCVTISIGVTTFSPGNSLHEIINCADKAMYFSKTKGRNKVHIYKATSVNS